MLKNLPRQYKNNLFKRALALRSQNVWIAKQATSIEKMDRKNPGKNKKSNRRA